MCQAPVARLLDYGTVERTKTAGYLDEAKLTFIRQACH